MPKARGNSRAATNSNHNHPVADNLLGREFIVNQPNTVYSGDITYIHTDEGTLYLAVLIDLYSRVIVGRSISSRMTADLVNDALLRQCGNVTP